MTPPARTVAIVVNWNGWDWTERCLADLAASREPLDIVVVDNGSTDESVDRLRRLDHPRMEAVLLPANRGFSAALNAGIDHVRDRDHEFVWLLNNDIRVPPASHGGMLRAADESCVPTVWTPDLASPTGTAQHVGGVWARDGSRASLVTADDAEAASSSDFWLTGAALFCSRATLARIGRFDESYFIYWEDVDWSFRATRAGIRLRAAHGIRVIHAGTQAFGGSGSPLSTFLLARNEIRIARLYAPANLRRAALLRVVARQLRWALLLERRAGRAIAEAVLAGMLAGLAGQRGSAGVVPIPAARVAQALTHALATSHRLERAASRLSGAAGEEGLDTPVDPSSLGADRRPGSVTHVVDQA